MPTVSTMDATPAPSVIPIQVPIEALTPRPEDPLLGLLAHTPLAILCDLDGTLIPFAATPEEAVPDARTRALVSELASVPGVTFAVVSGRTKADLERFFPDVPLVAEHGAFRRIHGVWRAVGEAKGELAELKEKLEEVVARYPRAHLEQKATGLVVHYRKLAPREREAFVIDATTVIDAFTSQSPEYECSPSVLALDVRPSQIRKSTAVPWLREQAGPGARVLALGDDLTDEHMFGALQQGDEAIVVRHGARRRTKARWELAGHEQVVAFLGGVLARRTGSAAGLAPLPSPTGDREARRAEAPPDRLLVVSNRLPALRNAEDGRPAQVGGLVSALRPALESASGLWLGWNGHTIEDSEEPSATFDGDASPGLLGVDLKKRLYRDYYNGFCNKVLWPLFHCFPERVRLSHEGWNAYEEAHRTFADVAVKVVGPHGTVWVHDYHLLLLARDLRARGHVGPIGHFLHVPFPPPDLFETIPWHREILDALLAFDLLGFHTPGFLRNFQATIQALHGARVTDHGIVHDGRLTRTGVFPIGILPDDYRGVTAPDFAEEKEGLFRILGPAKLVLGVDRLDYTKGIPERLLAFGKLLDRHPELRTKVSLVQISVPSRADLPFYAEQRTQIENIVGRINGQYGEAHWAPVRYFYRSYAAPQLAELYRAAAVGYVTPLRDGMNLVAKEYVAAQDSDDPGVLLLSRFAGAAVELDAALLTNPYDLDGMADDLYRALTMPLEERRTRQRKLLATVLGSTATTWGNAFLAALADAARDAVRVATT